MKATRAPVDAHAHCGIIDTMPPQDFADYKGAAAGSGIGTVVMFSPVQEIYDRYDPHFQDNRKWREKRARSNAYLLTVGDEDLAVIPYFFIWNDFAVDQITPRHKGIKWHRHPGEPVYHYDDPRCRAAIGDIRKRRMPVILEEELRHTIRFVTELAVGVRVIIPHLGGLNGGYHAIADAGLWAMDHVYADTALAGRSEIMAYLNTYGEDRLLFGSDFPFGNPRSELEKLLQLGLDQRRLDMILWGNIQHLLADSNLPDEAF